MAAATLFALPIVVLLLAMGAGSRVMAEDWPQLLGPRGTGVSGETGLLDKFPASGGPPIVWEQEIGTGYGAPSIRGDLLVFHHRRGDEEIVEALEKTTGKSVWHFNYPSHFQDPVPLEAQDSTTDEMVNMMKRGCSD